MIVVRKQSRRMVRYFRPDDGIAPVMYLMIIKLLIYIYHLKYIDLLNQCSKLPRQNYCVRTFFHNACFTEKIKNLFRMNTFQM